MCLSGQGSQVDSNFLIGAGIADITGPAADIVMMGYAKGSQKSAGIHIRQWSRAYVIADAENSSRIAFVSIDACMGAQLVKLKVVQKLKAMYGDLYTDENVCISGIHSHSTPGGFLQYILFDITGLGFYKQTLDALVDGIVRSIVKAHTNVKPGNIFYNSGDLLETNINRSPTSYLRNPSEERAKYEHDVDKQMVLLKLVDDTGKDIGMINWFAVHCTSMNNTNKLISGDNKGFASQLFERDMNAGKFPGNGSFVAAFAQSNEGDVSPNTRGPHCLDTGLPCDKNTSTCNGKTELCVASGPGVDMFDSAFIIGTNQYKRAKELYNSATTKITGGVGARHQNVHMPGYEVNLNSTFTAQLCDPAMGFSFAAGTTDGPGDFDFTQGDTSGNPFWDAISHLLSKPTDEQVKCQHPKPILLNTGSMSKPYAWQPTIVPTQLLQIGSIYLVAVPGEFTTMSGRRLRDSVGQALKVNGVENPIPVIAGLSNTYSDYIATYEEYQAQRYEAASTIFGPHTLQGYQQIFTELAVALAKNESVSSGPDTPDLTERQLSFVPPVIFDHAPSGSEYGSIIRDVNPVYKPGERVNVSFVSANPRNNLRTEGTFLKVERTIDNITWTEVATDSMWETRFYWVRTSTILGESIAVITWDIPPATPTGRYRVSHFGNHKSITGSITAFSGSSSVFQIVSSDSRNELWERQRNLETNETPRSSWYEESQRRIH